MYLINGMPEFQNPMAVVFGAGGIEAGGRVGTQRFNQGIVSRRGSGKRGNLTTGLGSMVAGGITGNRIKQTLHALHLFSSKSSWKHFQTFVREPAKIRFFLLYMPLDKRRASSEITRPSRVPVTAPSSRGDIAIHVPLRRKPQQGVL